jgi:TPR repeat protein
MTGRPGVPVDLAKMADYFDRACDAGEAWGCVNAGKSYEQGTGVQANPTIALSFYRRGCEKKNADACAAQKRLQPAQ